MYYSFNTNEMYTKVAKCSQNINHIDLYEFLSYIVESKCNEWKLTICEYYNNDDVIDDIIE